jgi:hypothetical protein
MTINDELVVVYPFAYFTTLHQLLMLQGDVMNPGRC